MVFLPTKLGDFVRANVGKYSSTMQHMGIIGVSVAYAFSLNQSIDKDVGVWRHKMMLHVSKSATLQTFLEIQILGCEC